MIDTRTIASAVLQNLKNTRDPRSTGAFHAVLIGDNAASRNFLKQKAKIASELGIEFRIHEWPEDNPTHVIKEKIRAIGVRSSCSGVIVQLPLPKRFHKDDVHLILNEIPPAKDPDLLSETSLGAFYTGRSVVRPPSVGTVEEILAHEKKELAGTKVVLIGAGLLIGKPLGMWLQHRLAKTRLKELVILDDSVTDIHEETVTADIVVSGAGHGHLFSAEHLKHGATVIDFGFSRKEEKITGDFDPANAEAANIRYTPTPGGTGPILVAKLMENFVKLDGLKH